MIQSAADLIDYVNLVGFLPLLNIGVDGWSAEDATDEEYGYIKHPEGGWEWPLWEWKGSVIRESGCSYGKFFDRKAAFISNNWWPDFCNYRRSVYPRPEQESIEGQILDTLRYHDSLTTRELRAACGFTGLGMRSRFDHYITRLEMGGYIVTENFVYPHDKHGNRYGWGWSLLTTPERLFGKELCKTPHTPQHSLELIINQLRHIITEKVSDKRILRLVTKI